MLSARQLIGRWASPAPETIRNADGSVIYGQREFVFTEKAWALHFQAFGDAAATFQLFGLRLEGTYTLGGPSAAVPSAQEAEFFFTGRHVTAYAPMLDMFKNVTTGIEWQAGVEQDVSATGALFIPSVANAPVEHDLVQLENGQLRLGDRSGDLTKARPQTLGEPLARR
jgi:hypothetical protein